MPKCDDDCYPQPHMPKLVSLSEAAERLDISRRHLFRLIQTRQLTRHKRIGDRQVYLEAGQLRRLTGLHPVQKQSPGKAEA